MTSDDGHPEAERLAEYADGVLTAGERREIERHMVECSDCRAAVAETMAFLRAEAGLITPLPKPVIPFRRRRWMTGVAAGLAVAAALVLAIRVVRPAWLDDVLGPRTDRPELQELIAALANEPARPVEGQLTGGFKYAPPPSPKRGPGDRDVSPDVRIAAAKIEKLAASQDRPENQAALGVAYLAVGDVDKGVEALEGAGRRMPSNGRFQSDLAAAYIARAQSTGHEEDWRRALAAAERAIQLGPKQPEALFNRALALEGLHLDQQARDAWTAYRAVATSPQWEEEAAQKLRSLRKPATAVRPPRQREPITLPAA
jgi:tetratricopeptide (TPR) repeat protein